MAAITLYRNSDGSDIANTYVTKEYVMDWYPDLVPAMKNPTYWLCGYNTNGQFGDGTTSNKSSFASISGNMVNYGWKQISGGSQHIALIKTDGTLWSCGTGANGRLGDTTVSNRTSPVQVSGAGSWNYISCGSKSTFGIKTDGTLWSWGSNDAGILGDGTSISKSSPVQVAGGGTTWKQISNGGESAAVKTDGTLWTWGYNFYGELGTNNTSSYSSPVTVAGGGTNWKQVSSGFGFMAAIKTDGTLWTWGFNNKGQLGDGTVTRRSSPGTVAGGGTNWKQVSSCYYSTAAIKTDGTVWTCGYNDKGQLGDGTTTNRSSPVTIAGGGTNWKQVLGIQKSTFGIKTDGTLWSWGQNNVGQLGDGTTSSRSSPGTTVGGGTNWKQISNFNFVSIAIAAISEAEGW